MSVCSFKFKHPFTCIVSGTTSSGKTFFTRNLLSGWKYLIDIKSKKKIKVLWFHGQKQFIHDEPIPNVEIVYHENLPNQESIENFQPDLIVIDDLMGNSTNDDNVKELFIKGSHHKNISIIYIVQNIFNRDKNQRTISLNAHYIVVMRGIRLTQQVGILANQIFPGKSKQVIEVFKRATKQNFGYLIFDLHPQSEERFRLRSRIFKHELTNLQQSEADSCPKF